MIPADPPDLYGRCGFTYTALPVRVVFGRGTLARLAGEVEAMGCRRVLVLSSPEQAGDARGVADRLGGFGAGVFAGAAMHTPVAVTEQALAQVRAAGADGLLSLGGGSATGLGKALALRTGLPQVAVPTTYAGSEMTPILGQTENGRKTTQRDVRLLPQVVVYDVDLTLGLPVALSVTSGLNAIAHAVEALYAQDANPMTSALAEQGIASLARALPGVVADPADAGARSDALFGAWACGMCLGTVGMALHHKLCHVLGGSFDLPHAPVHAVILPYAVAYNSLAAAGPLARVARALGAEDPAAGLFALSGALGARRSLQEIGMLESDLDRAADLAVQSPYWNPRLVERDGIRALLDDAFFGRQPATGRPAPCNWESSHA